MATPTIKGLKTIVWGTNNAMNSPAGAVIQSCKATPKNGAPVELEDGNGHALTEVFLNDGFDATVVCLYDYSKNWPAEAARVTLNLPFAGNNNANVQTKAFECFVAADPEPDLERKKEATISYKISFRPNLDMVNW